MLALITNDDGIGSPGLRALALAALDAGLDTVVAAPGWDSSGASASLTAVEKDGKLLIERRELEGLNDVAAFAVEAAPAFIVRAAISGAFGPSPDVVLSGVNHGPNTGQAVLHSGTVGAALTASTSRRASLAVSIDMGEPTHWGTAQEIAVAVIPWVVAADPPVVLNLNVPNVTPERVRGLERARLASVGAVQAMVTETGAGYVKLDYRGVGAEHEPGTDAALLASGVACFTALRSTCEAQTVDTTSLRLPAGDASGIRAGPDA